MNDWHRLFLEEMKLRGLSAQTVLHYSGWIRRLSIFHGRSPELLTRADIHAYLLHLKAREVRPTTYHLALAAFRFFYRLRGLETVVAGFRHPSIPRRPREVLSEQEIERILNQARSLRDKTFFNLVYASGLRLREALNLSVDDVDLERRIVLVRSGKNDLSRQSIFGASTEALLREYLFRQRPPKPFLFPSHNLSLRPLAARAVQHAFSLAVARSGIKKSASLHSLRHAFATHLAERNTNLFIIMRLLGHRNLRTTQVYLGESSVERLHVRSPVDHLADNLDLRTLPSPIQLSLDPRLLS